MLRVIMVSKTDVKFLITGKMFCNSVMTGIVVIFFFSFHFAVYISVNHYVEHQMLYDVICQLYISFNKRQTYVILG